MKILFTGGGTLGPVTPLLAVISELKKRDASVEIVFVGTHRGPEKRLVDKLGIPFTAFKAPKLRRYLSLQNFLIPVEMVRSLLAARRILKQEKPDIVVGAGGYTQVPLGIMCKFMGCKLLIHQQDVVPSLSNRILVQFADHITVTFEKSLRDFPESRSTLTGNPVRLLFDHGDAKKGRELLGIKGDRPVVLAVGGGTGSAFLNEIILLGTPRWTKFADIVHITGLEKSPMRPPTLEHPDRYHMLDFVGEDIVHYFAAADIVITRAGLGTTTELAALAKPIIIVPIPDSQQEVNAAYLAERNAGRVYRELDLTPEQLVTFTHDLVGKPEEMQKLGENLKKIFIAGAREAVAEKILEIAKS